MGLEASAQDGDVGVASPGRVVVYLTGRAAVAGVGSSADAKALRYMATGVFNHPIPEQSVMCAVCRACPSRRRSNIGLM